MGITLMRGTVIQVGGDGDSGGDDDGDGDDGDGDDGGRERVMGFFCLINSRQWKKMMPLPFASSAVVAHPRANK